MKIDKYGEVTMSGEEMQDITQFIQENPQFAELPWRETLQIYMKHLEDTKNT